MENNELNIKITSTMNKALESIDRLISKTKNADSVVTKMFAHIDKEGQLTGFTTEFKNLNSTMNETTNVAKKLKSALDLTTIYTSIKAISRKFYGLVEQTIDYSEALNLFNVVLDESQTKALKFQNTMNEAFGTNQTETLTRQGLYQSMAENMGIASDYAYIMSENTTKLVNDISSLYNKNENTVAEALRAGIYAGQTKPLRSFGMDVTEKTLQPELDRLGIDRTVRELSQAEKQLLRYISVLRQSTEAQGDWANTIESPANQLKIFKNQIEETKKSIGNLFVGAFAKILPYANAIVMVVEEVANAIASLLGIDVSDYNTSIADIGDAFVDLEEDIDGATGSAKELKRQLLKFDQVNNINEDKSSNGSSSVSSGIDQRLLDAINGYDNGMNSVKMKAIEIRDRIMEWLGFTKEVDSVTGDVYFNFEKITGGTALGALAVGGVIFNGIAKIYGFLKGIKGIASIGSGTATIAGLSLGSWGAIIASALGQTLNLKHQTNQITDKLQEGKSLWEALYIPDSATDFFSKIIARNSFTMMFGGTGEIALTILEIADAFDLLNTKTEEEEKSLSELEDKWKGLTTSLTDVSFDISKISLYDNLIIDEITQENIKRNLSKLTSDLSNMINEEKQKMLEGINNMQKEGYISFSESEETIEKMNKYYSSIENSTEKSQTRINEILKNASEEKRKLTSSEKNEISELYEQIQENIVNSISTSSSEQQIILKKMKTGNSKISKEVAHNLISDALNVKNNAIESAKEQYTETLRQAQKMYDIGAITEEQYDKIALEAEKTKDETIASAKEEYEGVWNEFEKSQSNIADYIDKDTGEIKSNWASFWIDIENIFSEKLDKIKSWWDVKVSKFFTKEYWSEKWDIVKEIATIKLNELKEKILGKYKEIKSWFDTNVLKFFTKEYWSEKWGVVERWWGKNVAKYFTKEYWQNKLDLSSIKIKTPHISWDENGKEATGLTKKILETLSLPTKLPKLSVSWYENGGLPPVGELFIAREAGPELVGKIGSHTAVANNNQIVEGIKAGVYEAVSMAMANMGSSNVNVSVKADKGFIVETAVDGIQQHVNATGELPFTVPI